MVIGQPITGNFVPKKTYVSAINMLNPLSMIDLLNKHNVQTTLRVINDFPIDYNRNKFVDEALELGADYLMFMDMDMTFPSNMINNLLELISDEHPVVTGMYYIKRPPFRPVMGRYVDWDEELSKKKDHLDKLGFVKDDKQLLMWCPVTYFDDKPFEVDVIGMGCVLIKREVFEKLRKQPEEEVKAHPRAYFKYSPDPRKEESQNCISEDMFFCARVKKAGIKILCDPRVQCGHIMEMESNKDLYTASRDSSFKLSKEKDPKEYEEAMKQIIDVRKAA